MKSKVIIDTGPLVALINRKEKYHTWVRNSLVTIASPLVTCEAVVTESCYLLRNIYGGNDAVMGLIDREKLQITFSLKNEVKAIQKLMQTYKSVPMSLTDGCLVRMAELDKERIIFTLDSDFRIYRKNIHQVINLIYPDGIT